EEHMGMNPLPSVPGELNNIVKEGDNDEAGVLPGIVKLNSEFTAQSLLDTLKEKAYPAVHLASHFIFKAAGTDQDSFLLLGDGGGLTLARIRDEFDFQGIDMLTLSACETGMGSVGADGREIEGFGVLAQKKGAKSVIATLWPVTDKSTGLFMQTMYRIHAENPDMTKSEAVREAQLTLLKNRQFSHPHYWAPFILLGNWL
ncbi:MAG: CHAT domain-containing protein, partial [Pseudomonadota bacterium]